MVLCVGCCVGFRVWSRGTGKNICDRIGWQMIRSGGLVQWQRVVGVGIKWYHEVCSAQVHRRHYGDKKGSADVDTKETEQHVNSTPWYLQSDYVHPMRQDNIPTRSRQLNTDPLIPHGTPQTIADITRFIAKETALQEVEVLDLGKRDPPPIWGAETYMVFAVARSARHLQSACSAITTHIKHTYKARVSTDGMPSKDAILLRRRRLRRKIAKRVLKGLSTDDILPEQPLGWICMEVPSENLVVQLLTEQGIQDTELKKFWKSSAAERDREFEAHRREIMQEEYYYYGKSRMKPGVRSMHTLVRHLEGTAPDIPAQQGLTAHEMIDRIKGSGRFPAVATDRIVESIKQLTMDGDYQSVKKVQGYLQPTESFDPTIYVLSAHINHLLQARTHYALNVLLYKTADFLSSFEDAMPESPNSKHLWLQMLLYLCASKISPKSFPLRNIVPTIHQRLSRAQPFERDEIAALPLALISADQNFAFNQSQSVKSDTVTDRLVRLRKAHETLALTSTSPSINPEPLFRALFAACCDQLPSQKDIVSPPYFSMPKVWFDHRALQIEAMASQLSVRFTRKFWDEILTTYALAGQWPAFWKRWAEVEVSGAERDEAMYTLFWALIARSQNVREIKLALRKEWLNMLRWLDEINNDNLLQAVNYCLRHVCSNQDLENNSGEFKHVMLFMAKYS